MAIIYRHYVCIMYLIEHNIYKNPRILVSGGDVIAYLSSYIVVNMKNRAKDKKRGNVKVDVGHF